MEREELRPIDLTGESSPREWTLGAPHDGIESLLVIRSWTCSQDSPTATTVLNPLGRYLQYSTVM